MTLQRNLKQDVTHWAVTPDGFGGFSFIAPAPLKGRWEEVAELFRDPAGEEEVSKATVYLSADVVTSDYLFLGTTAAVDPTAIADTFQVRQFHKTPDLRLLDFERKAFL